MVVSSAEKTGSAPANSTAEPAVAPTPPPPAALAKAVTRGFASLKVQAVFYRTNNPVVVINGEMFGCGDHVNGVEIVAISPSGVTLTYDGQQKVVTVE